MNMFYKIELEEVLGGDVHVLAELLLLVFSPNILVYVKDRFSRRFGSRRDAFLPLFPP
jgi:hypothetical protein